MGLFSRWKQHKRDEFRQKTAPYEAARNEIWNREIDRLGKQEFHRRMDVVSNYQIGRGGPSGFEDWQRQLDAEIMERVLQLARTQD